MHRTFLALMVAYSSSTFQLIGKAESQKKKKLGLKIDFQKCSKMELYTIYNGAFQKNFNFSK